MTRLGHRAALVCCCLFTAGTPLLADDDDKVLPLLKTFVAEFVEITPGEGQFPRSFQMGSAHGHPSEQPVHEVTLRDSFAMAKYEVPQNLYEAVMGNNPSKWKGRRNSVEMMTFAEAVEFCKKTTALLRKHELINDAETIRLPSEAEWEYCCRAGTKTEYSFGDDAVKLGDAGTKASLLDEFGWHTGNAAGNDPPVGAKKPNAWGLYDMHGYLWEFTADNWSPDYAAAPADGAIQVTKPSPWTQFTEPQYVLRSGSWKNRYTELRSATRIPITRGIRDDAVGFRCVKAKNVVP